MNLFESLCRGQAVDGYLPTGEFRQPEEGEPFLSSNGVSVIDSRLNVNGPRLILKSESVPERISPYGRRRIIEALESMSISLSVIGTELGEIR